MAIFFILITANLTMQRNSLRANSLLSEKIAALDLERVVTQYLAVHENCSSLLRIENLIEPSEALISNFGALNKSNFHSIRLKRLGTDSESIIEHGAAASALNPRLTISKDDGISLHIFGPSSAALSIKFDDQLLQQPLKPLLFPISLKSNPSAQPYPTLEPCPEQVMQKLRFEGSVNVSGSACPSTYVGGFCDSAFRKKITFSQNFQAPPQVIVRPRGESIAQTCPCCLGASDQMIIWTENITTSSFEVRTSISPESASCGDPYSSWSAELHFDWTAIGI